MAGVLIADSPSNANNISSIVPQELRTVHNIAGYNDGLRNTVTLGSHLAPNRQALSAVSIRSVAFATR